MTEQGLIAIDDFHQANVRGMYACGDNSGRQPISNAVATGSVTGILVNNELTEAAFTQKW